MPIEATDEENTQLGAFPLAPYAEIHVSKILFSCNLVFDCCICEDDTGGCESILQRINAAASSDVNIRDLLIHRLSVELF